MYQRTKFFRNKFIRNSTGLLFISFFMAYRFKDGDYSFLPQVILFFIVGLVWLYFGLRLRKNLKEKLKRSPQVI